jgi:hypothetical protein
MRAPPVSEQEKGRRELACAWAIGPRVKRSEASARLGRAVEAEERKRPAGLGHAGREGEREKEKEIVGRAQRENEGVKEMHLNLNLKFKFNLKTNNKTMQCGMKCTRPIFPLFLSMVKQITINSW